MKLRQADISSAFLYGDLSESETVYMKCPPGVKYKKGEVMVMCLHKCIYDLKQVSRRFYHKLRNILIGIGYQPTKSDPCLYRRVKNGREGDIDRSGRGQFVDHGCHRPRNQTCDRVIQCLRN